MKLYGKELDEELEKRKQCRESRIERRIGAKEAARRANISTEELVDFENGRDICPHEEYENQKNISPFANNLKVCKKCGKIENSIEKINISNIEKAYDVFRYIVKNRHLKDNVFLGLN